jgi:hypothetical protein
VIYKYALDNIPKDKSQDLYRAYTIHEKKYGDRTGIESVITSKRRFQYEEALNENPLDYDTWFDLLKLLESAEEIDAELTRETYERAISHVPPAPVIIYMLTTYFAEQVLLTILLLSDITRIRLCTYTCYIYRKNPIGVVTSISG